MSFIMCMGSFALGLSLNKSSKFLGWLPLHIKTKYQNKRKIKPRKNFATAYRHFSLEDLCYVRYIIKKETRRKNVL